MNSKTQKLIQVISSIGMLISAFLPWFIYESSYSANVNAFGMSFNSSASTGSQSIMGVMIGPSQITLLFSVAAIVFTFIRFRFAFIFGAVNLLLGIYTAFFWNQYDVSISAGGFSGHSGLSIALGLYLFLTLSAAYLAVTLIPFIKGLKGAERPAKQAYAPPAYTTPAVQGQPAPEVQLYTRSSDTYSQSLNTGVLVKPAVVITICTSLLAVAIGLALLAYSKSSVAVQANTASNTPPDAPMQRQQNRTKRSNTAQTQESDETSGLHHYGEEQSPNAYAGEYPQASLRELDIDDIKDLSKTQLKLMRNEIFARHGYIFSSPDLSNYFNKQPWYQPQYNDISDQLTPTEKANIAFIKRYE